MRASSETAAKQLAWEMESRKSVELRVRADFFSDVTGREGPDWYNAIEEHYTENAFGKRACDTTFLRNGTPTHHFSYYDDTSRCADVNFRKEDLKLQNSVMIKRQYRIEDQMGDRMERPHPLQLLYVGREPLHKALAKAKELGEGRVLGRGCDLFLFERVRWAFPQDHIYYLDRETSIPLKVESFRDEASRQKQEPLWVWTAQSVDVIQGHTIPLKSEMSTPQAGDQSPMTWKYEVTSVEFGKDHPASTFWPTIQPGVDVLDTVASKRYKTSGQPLPSSKLDQGRATTSQPIQAIPPTGWANIISGVTLGLGIALLVAVGLYRWRRG